MKDIKLLLFSDLVNDETPILKSIITAESAVYNDNYWTVQDGIEYKIAPDGIYKSIQSFNEINVFDKTISNRAYQLLNQSIKRPREMDLKELKDYMSLLKIENLTDEYAFILNKYYQRFSQSFSCILLALCGVILGFTRPREKRYVGFTLGAMIIFLYYAIVPFLDMLAQKGILFPVISAWLPCVMVFVAMSVVYKYKKL